jgi:hypothetical protein
MVRMKEGIFLSGGSSVISLLRAESPRDVNVAIISSVHGKNLGMKEGKWWEVSVCRREMELSRLCRQLYLLLRLANRQATCLQILRFGSEAGTHLE